MNEVPLIELMTVVERAVRPVKAVRSDKRRMREELLAHLLTVFDEEFNLSGDRRAALQRTIDRFGAPAEVSAELRQAASWRARLGYRFEAGLFGDPPDRLRGSILLSIAGGILPLLLGMPLVLFHIAIHGNDFETLIIVRMLLVLSVFTAVVILSIVTLAMQIGRGVFGRRLHLHQLSVSPRATALYLAVSLVLFPALGFFTMWGILGDARAALHHARWCCYLAPLAPLLFALIGRGAVKEELADQDWDRLAIDR